MRKTMWSWLGFALLTAVLSLSLLREAAAQSEAPLTRAELIAYCQKNVHPWDDSRHQADIQNVIKLIEKRGVVFKFSGFDEELHKAASGASPLYSAIENNYISPRKGLVSQSGAPLTRAELLQYLEDNMHPWGDPRHKADKEKVIELIKGRGVDFKVAGFDAELHKAASGASDLLSPIEKNYRPAGGKTSAGPNPPPPGTTSSSGGTGSALFGTWSVAVVGQTQHTNRDVTTVSASWGPIGSLIINPDGTYSWNRSASERRRGRWRNATNDELRDSGERLVLLHAFEDVDWIVYQQEKKDRIIVAQLKALYRREFGSR